MSKRLSLKNRVGLLLIEWGHKLSSINTVSESDSTLVDTWNGASEPPQHWLKMVQARAPQLLDKANRPTDSWQSVYSHSEGDHLPSHDDLLARPPKVNSSNMRSSFSAHSSSSSTVKKKLGDASISPLVPTKSGDRPIVGLPSKNHRKPSFTLQKSNNTSIDPDSNLDIPDTIDSLKRSTSETLGEPKNRRVKSNFSIVVKNSEPVCEQKNDVRSDAENSNQAESPMKVSSKKSVAMSVEREGRKPYLGSMLEIEESMQKLPSEVNDSLLQSNVLNPSSQQHRLNADAFYSNSVKQHSFGVSVNTDHPDDVTHDEKIAPPNFESDVISDKESLWHVDFENEKPKGVSNFTSSMAKEEQSVWPAIKGDDDILDSRWPPLLGEEFESVMSPEYSPIMNTVRSITPDFQVLTSLEKVGELWNA